MGYSRRTSLFVAAAVAGLGPWASWAAGTNEPDAAGMAEAASAGLPAAADMAVEDVAYFETHVRPLLLKRCVSCHSAADDTLEGSLALDSRAGWAEGGDHGPAIVPGDAEASLLIRAVRYADPDLQMPPDRRLADEEIARLEEWVRRGAVDPRDGLPRREGGPDPSDPVAGREHWAFRPLGDPPPPTVTDGSWPLAELDAFVLARLEAEGLRPAADADPNTLLRRLSVALTGLPPSLEQITTFTADPSPAAYERLVDEMLASRQFGERWGRHWLDLARYADSNGLDENFLFREAWRYRNWVIDAVAADMPFDRFLEQQLAGDLLPYGSTDERDRQRIAAGFLTIGPKVLLGNPAEKQKMEVADELIDTLGRAILGQSLGCARCHDHKFDPVPTADYYALAGIFTSTNVMESRYMLGEQRVMERLVGLGDGGEAVDDAYEAYWRERPALQKRQERAVAVLAGLVAGDAAAGDAAAVEKLAGDEAEAVAEAARDPATPRETRVQVQRALVADLDRQIATPPGIPPRAMSPRDHEQPADEFVRLAGDPDRKAASVPRGFLQVCTTEPPVIPADASGRLQLAAWLVDREHGAGGLAARVLANRIWHHLIGRGIVRTVDNFGRTGEPPTHPELLDHLATELVAANWSLKSLIRQVVLSRSFMMSSRHDAEAAAIDPANTLLWRAHRRRLDPESLRDAMLSAAGTLDLAPMDSTVNYLGDQATAVGGNTNRRRTDFPCRSVYLPVIRNDLPEIFDRLDFTDPHRTTGMRPQTTVATQGLFMLNDEQVMDAAAATARRVLEATAAAAASEPLASGGLASGAAAPAGPEEEALTRLFLLVTGSPPGESERESLRGFIDEIEAAQAAAGVEKPRERAWALACHAVFASSRFQIIE